MSKLGIANSFVYKAELAKKKEKDEVVVLQAVDNNAKDMAALQALKNKKEDLQKENEGR